MARLLRRQKSRKLWVLVTLLVLWGWCWNRSPGFLGSGSPPRPSEGQRLATNQQLGQAVKERDDEILEQLRDDEGAYQADLLGSPRPLFTLTEQWGLLGLLVGLVVLLASMGGMESSFLDLLQGGWDQTQAMEALTTLNEGTAAAGAEVAGGILEPGLSIALPGLLASLGSLAGLVVQGIKDEKRCRIRPRALGE
ncbi:unnamed protein product [Cladocopium goreaui]|uniref:Uncharacterized protein n=1 Tax=Cladocopium goreaui TaxID=2562237 RepID=A0A9P1CEY2_9DINO|nr:unnamed protein product [Cladocopium goreaui]